jgi:hypothetical protein
MSLQSIGGGTLRLSYRGSPGMNYALERAFNLTPSAQWESQTTNTTAANGYIVLTNTVSPATNVLYRMRLVPSP